VNTIKNIYTMIEGMTPPADGATQEEKDKYEREWNIAVFYLDNFLPITPGADDWPSPLRAYTLFVDPEREFNGEKKAFISATSEAYGLLAYENYLDCWIKKFEHGLVDNKKSKKGYQQPTYNKNDTTTHIYKAKWSDAHSGQSSGWDEAAYPKLNEYKKLIKDFRTKDEAAGYPVLKKCQNILKAEYGVEDPVEGQEPPKKKQRRGKNSQNVAAVDEGAEVEVDFDFDDSD